MLQRLCKTSVKKNLYYEIKDKVIEEAFDGFRSVKKTAKVKVYGTDSNKEVRARLIEILYDRVTYHKDKFIAPILHHEMESMEVKKNGKVEHSQNSHDDQVFSYLMAMRVWYDGIDIAERYGIRKNTIKTDEDIDIEQLSVEANQFGGMSPVDVDQMVSEMNGEDTSEVEDQLEYIKKASSYTLNKDFYEAKSKRDEECLQQLLSTNPEARRIYAERYHLDLNDATAGGLVNNGFVDLPSELFGDTEVMDDYDNINDDNVVGNLAGHWRTLL